MKIVLTGGGTGGHFYPLIAVAEELLAEAERLKLADFKMYYFSDVPYDEIVLYETKLEFRSIPSGKNRLYFSIWNFIDLFKVAWGVIVAVWKLFLIYPDVVFGKGGYASFPTLMAARILRIPFLIHESDSVPGRVNKMMGKYADKVAISFVEAAEHFPKNKTALTGRPVRAEIARTIPDGAMEYFSLEPNVPLIFVLGGSQGAKVINDTIVELVADLVENYQIIHQTGENNLEDAKVIADSFLLGSPHKDRYRPYGFLSKLGMAMAGAKASLVISRAGSQIFEIAAWGVPAILIPITNSNGDHQRKNAYAYASSGACQVIEESNLTPHVLLNEVQRIISNSEISNEMGKDAKKFFKPDAAKTIALELIRYGVEHEVGEKLPQTYK